uniref:RING-type domain-containing protein n=1 Tax=Knipowitschia caucasica TaxID=637954 RepID=A0AAV2JJA4_KNICA
MERDVSLPGQVCGRIRRWPHQALAASGAGRIRRWPHQALAASGAGRIRRWPLSASISGSCTSDVRRLSAPSSPSCSPHSPSSSLLYASESNLSFSLREHCSTAAFSSTGTSPSSPLRSLPQLPSFPSSSWSDECTICYENEVDTVLYSCGHMCLCYQCGLKLKKMSNACCPICRRTIKDIIKTYRST